MNKTDDTHLYSSSIIQTFLDYLADAHPDINIEKILSSSGILESEAADRAHWFTQRQTDRFQEVVTAMTGDAQIARKAGRYSASSKALSLMKQYVIGLMTVEAVYLSMAKFFRLFTRGSTVSVRKLGPSRIELISTPAPGVEEKPYQCDNRLGFIEAIPKPFTNLYATVEHPECLHRGDSVCRYVVAWSDPPSLRLKLARNYALLASGLSVLIGFFFLGPLALTLITLVSLLLIFSLSLAFHIRKNGELEKIIESHHQIAEEQLVDSKVRYDNALLVQEIGQTTAAVLNIDDLMNQLAHLMNNRLDFDRGLIMLADDTGAHLVYSAGYGYNESEIRHLKNTVFRLNNPGSKGIFVRCFHDQKPITVNNLSEIEDSMSARSIKIAHDMRVHALLCVPIVFEKTSLGILAVDNVQSKAPLKKSDVNLLQGIASHIAISINNARLFQKLQESEEKYRQTLESITEAYYETDLSGQLLFMNRALCEMLGYTYDELASSRFDLYFTEDGRKQYQRLSEKIQESRTPVRFANFEMLRKDGATLTVDLSASLKIDVQQKAIGLRGIIRDATERLQLEKERMLLENQLVQAQKMEAIGTLAGGIAHNFNNWLSGILGNISLIRIDADHQPAVLDRIDKIENIVENAAKMNQQLLGYARGGRYEIKPMNINGIVRESADTFGAAKKEISIRLSLDENLHMVNADRSQIEQVLWNLYVNAVEAMPERGELTIETRNVQARKDTNGLSESDCQDYVQISVSDTGIGIEKKVLERIFDPFFTTKTGKGTGLGLSSVYGIVQSHNGYLDVISEPGKGSTFQIFLPSVVQECATHEIITKAEVRGRETILLVDDEDMILDTSSLLLQRLGYRIITASSGHEALRIYRASGHAIDLVIVDMIMPEMSGGELYAQLKKINPCVKALLSSGYSLNDKAQKIIDEGINGFIQKPFGIHQLSRQIQEILSAP